MNYERIYSRLIERSSTRNLEGYTERHHIIPKHMGGDNASNNIAVLTAREHYIAHWLLWKIHKTPGSVMAFFSMVRNKSYQQRKTTSKQYERAKIAMSESKKGENNFWYGTNGPMGGKQHTEEFKARHKEIMKAASRYKKGLPVEEIPGLLAGKETRFVEGQQAWNKGKTGKDSHRYGKPLPEETKQKLRKPKPLTQCPHCGKIGGISSMKRWHFDNCRSNPTK